jgi:hypothetical protein
LERHGAFEGELDGEQCSITLWSMAELAQANTDIEIATIAPGFAAIAGDGGNEMFAVDAAGAVFMRPLIGMEPKNARHIFDSLRELAIRIVRSD